MKVQFIKNSHAKGCFVVLQPHDGSDDIFKALFRNNLHINVMDVIRVPHSTYKVYVYDLEKDGHINKMPAYFLNVKKVGPRNDMGKI